MPMLAQPTKIVKPDFSYTFYRVMLCIMATHILKLFLHSVSHTILVIQYQTIWQYSDGIP